MLVAMPAIFFALGVSRLLVLAVPAAVIGSYTVAIQSFSQTLVSVLLVSVAAVRTVGAGRPAAARAAVAVSLGAVAGGGRTWRRALAGLGGVVMVQYYYVAHQSSVVDCAGLCNTYRTVPNR